MNRFHFIWVIVLSIWILSGCDSTAHIKKGSYLVNANPTLKGNISINPEILYEGIKTKANRRVGFPKLFLNFYNLGQTIAADSSLAKRIYQKIDKKEFYAKKIAYWLVKVVGEPPVLVDSVQLQADAENLQSIYFSNGYFNAKVSYKVDPLFINSKAANISFKVIENEQYRIRSVNYVTPDKELMKIIIADTLNSLIQKGDLYNEENLSNERLRISNALKENGYFRFSPSFVNYVVDTTLSKMDSLFQIFLNTDFSKLTRSKIKHVDIDVILPDISEKYSINNIKLTIKNNVNQKTKLFEVYGPKLTLYQRNRLKLPFRMIYDFNEVVFYVPKKELTTFNYNFISEHISFKKGEYYSLENAQKTQKQLQMLSIFRNVMTNYEVNDSAHTIDVNINMATMFKNSFQLGVETFQSEDKRLNNNLPGVGGRLQLINRNFFKRAERFEISLSGNILWYKPADSLNVTKTLYQITPKISLTFPRLLIPFSTEFHPELNPSTSIVSTFNTENRQEYIRRSLGINYSYIWNSRKYSKLRYYMTVLDVTYINTTNITAEFNQLLNNLADNIEFFIRRDYTPRYSSKSSFYAIYSNYMLQKKKPSYYFKGGLEWGGNIPYIIDLFGKIDNIGDKIINDGLVNGKYLYGQFAKFHIEAKYFKPFLKKNYWVTRAQFGIAKGLNFTKIIPFENRFFIGGNNSLRGWQSNTLGPGIFKKDASNLVTYGGEFMMELNTEVRRSVWKYLELALFLDVGNVWFNKNGGFDNPDGQLSGKSFKFGWDLGVGFRFDFSFLILRMDIAQQIFDPSIDSYIIKKFPKDIGGKRIQYNLGIGYPF